MTSTTSTKTSTTKTTKVAAPKAVAVPATVILPFRALMHLMAVELGFTHTQPKTNVDTYTKGTEVVTLLWGGSRLLSFIAKGALVEGKGSMLQRAQSSMGKAIPLSGPGSKWNLSSKAKAEMLAYGLATFKVVPEA